MPEIPVRQWWERGLGIIICGAIAFAGNSSLAQITPDSTLPNNSNVTLDSGTFNITGGTQAGANLFHSFQQFSVPTNSTASFNNAVDIQNIISRVTGSSISNIDGLIRANGTANLFLINPNGIIFGPNASLNIGGSFVGSTANAIQFGNNGIFSASTPEAPSPLLTVNPSALLFNQIAVASIQNSSVAPAGQAPSGGTSSGLRVPNGRSLLLVSGDIKMDSGRLRAYGGRVELGGLASSGTVGLEVNGNNLSLSFPDNATRADVSLTNQASVRVDAGGGGSIAVNTRNIEILGGSFLNAGILEGLGSEAAVAGDITLNATGEIKVVGSYVFNNVASRATGNGGNINITTGSLSLNDGAALSASTLGQGNAGSVSVRATDSIELVNANIFSNVGTGATGNGGNINISSGSFSLTDRAQLSASTLGQGNAGSVSVRATDSIELVNANIFSNVGTGATGNGGNINISSGSFSLTDRAQLSASTFGQGNAGNITVDVTGPVTIAISKDGIFTGIYSYVGTGATGNGGNINISSGSFSLTRGQLRNDTFGQGNAGNISVRASDSVSLVNGYIRSSVGSGGMGKGGNININAATVTINGFASGIYSEVTTEATGNGGNINISSGSLSLSDGAQLNASTSGQGNAGSVSVQAIDSVSFTNATSFRRTGIFSTVEPGGVGKGGNINIKAGTLSLRDGATLETSVSEEFLDPAGRGDAGNVTVDVTGSVMIAGRPDEFYRQSSGILSYVGMGATGNGGNITISSGDFSLTDGAQLSASTFGQGNAGNVTVNVAQRVTITGVKDGFRSAISSSVERGATGNGGNITISSEDFSLTDGVYCLPAHMEKGMQVACRCEQQIRLSLSTMRASLAM